MWEDLPGAWRRRGVNEVGVGFDRHESSVKFHIERGAGVVTNEGTEGCIRSGGTATAETVAEKAGPADPLTRPCEPLVDGAAAKFRGFLHGALGSAGRIWIVEIVEQPLRRGNSR